MSNNVIAVPTSHSFSPHSPQHSHASVACPGRVAKPLHAPASQLSLRGSSLLPCFSARVQHTFRSCRAVYCILKAKTVACVRGVWWALTTFSRVWSHPHLPLCGWTVFYLLIDFTGGWVGKCLSLGLHSRRFFLLLFASIYPAKPLSSYPGHLTMRASSIVHIVAGCQARTAPIPCTCTSMHPAP